MKSIFLAGSALALIACAGGPEHTATWVQEKTDNQVIIGIHISLLKHPVETHAVGYEKMQTLANASCAESNNKTAKYTGKQERMTRGNAYDTWLERTYRCV